MKMTTNNAVALCINPQRSPARKRLRRDPSLLNEVEESETWRVQKWSLLDKKVSLDSAADMGVGPLESDSDEEIYSELLELPFPFEDNISDNSSIAKIMRNTISQEAFNTLTSKECKELLVYKPRRDLIFKIDHFQELCDEVILHIFRCLPKCSLVNAALVCRRWYQLAQDECLWTRMDLSHRSLEPGSLGHILSRQVLILRLSSSEICSPAVSSCVPAFHSEFRSRLLYLDLSMATISTSSLAVLFSKCYRLKKLSLEHVHVDDNVLKELSHNRELEVLNLAMVEGITKNGLGSLLSNCRKLKELNISWTGLTAISINQLSSHLPTTVDRLNLSGCRQRIDDDNILQLVKCCPNLRELDLSDCTGLTSRTIPCILHLEELNFLALSRCYFIPYRSLLMLKNMKSLTYLDIYGGHIEGEEFEEVQIHLGPTVNINKFKFSSVARPTVGQNHCSIWGLRAKD